MNRCPVSAITMKNDKEGFLQPVVDEAACVNCKLCIIICPVVTHEENHYFMPEVYASWNLDENIRKESTSGGIFTALAQAFMRQDGFVAGAIYDDDFEIRHILTNLPDDIERLRQSKYAQSRLDNLFEQIEDRLKHNEKVLFCGTPCQSAGLQSFLQKEYDNLYCCDFICRGVISPTVYKKFLADCNKRHDSNLIRVHFKNKEFGWNRFSTKLSYEDGSAYHLDRDSDYFMRGYLKQNLYMRTSCYSCDFKSIPRCSDISLGDFWGIGRYKASLDDNLGTSVVLVNSEKGRTLLHWAESKLYLERRIMEEVVAGNSCLCNSAEKGEFRKYFFERFQNQDFFKLIDRIERKSLHLTITERIMKNLSDFKRNILKG